MSNILRSTLKFSVKQFRISCLTHSNGALISRTLPCIYQPLSSGFHANVPHLSQAKIEANLKKIDIEARRNGRVSLREVEDIIEEIKSTKSATSAQCLLVIRCCGNLISEESPQKRTLLAKEIWNTFEKLGIDFDISHYNALLRVYLENEHAFVPTEMLSELEQKGIEPNRVTYQRFITRYCQIGDIEGATRILQFMRDKEMPINEIVFNALVMGHSKVGDMASAEGILNVMTQAGIEPSAETYTILICGYIEQGDTDKVKSTLRECEAKDVQFIDRDYLEMVYSLALKDLDFDEVLSKVKTSTGYNQEAINFVYKLVNAGKYESAFKIVRTMVRSTRLDGTLAPSGGFFISALIRHDASSAEVIKYCDKLIETNLNLQPIQIALENSLRFQKESLANELLRLAKERDIPIRPHYFWPLIVARGNANDAEGIYKVLSNMTTEFDLAINTETIRDYVLPFVLKNNTSVPSLLIDLKACGVPVAISVSSIVTNLLMAGRISEAAEVASAYRCSYSLYYIRKPLVNSFLKTLNVESFTTILKQIAAGIQWRASGEADKGDDDALPEYREFVGSVILEVVKLLKNSDNCKAVTENVLKLLCEKGVGISSRFAELIQGQLQGQLTQEISTLLEKLTADDLPTVEQSRTTGMRVSSSKLNENSLLQLYESMKAKGESTKVIQKQLFSLYGRTHELDKLLKLKEEMDRDNFVFTNGMYAYLIDSYVENDKLDDAWQIFQSRSEAELDFALNSVKMLKLAYLAVKNEQYDKAVEVLSKKALISDNGQSADNTPFITGSLCWRILNHLAEKGDLVNVRKFFDLIISNEYCNVSNILLGPLIKVHLVKDDLDGALAEFEDCCKKHRATPYKTELTKRCIEAENASGLQKITDLSTEIHGEINSLYDLMLSFLECGKLKQAKKILETPGLRLRQDRLQNACQKYQNSGSFEHLENLLQVTRNIGFIDRSDLYYNLLLIYDKAGEPQKALSLWLQMQEEDESPADAFLILLADVLKKNDMPVPFIVPEISTKPLPRVQQSESRVEMSPVSREFRKLLNTDNVDEALNFKNSKKSEQLNNTDLSLLMESLLKHGRYQESKEIFEEILSRGILPKIKILRYFAINAMRQGDVEFLESLNSKLDDKMKMYIMLRNRIGNAYVISGRTKEFLDKLEKEVDSANSKSEVEELLKSFPKSVLFSLLQKSPEFLPHVQKIAEKFLERDSQFIGAMNIIWLHHLMQNNDEEAEKIWIDYLQNSEKSIIFKGLCKEAVRTGNLQVLHKLKSFIERKPSSSPRSFGIIYGSIIKILVQQDKVPDAVQIFEEGVSKLQVENIMRNALEALEAACISKNIPFNYSIPNRSKDASDSDSD